MDKLTADSVLLKLRNYISAVDKIYDMDKSAGIVASVGFYKNAKELIDAYASGGGNDATGA